MKFVFEVVRHGARAPEILSGGRKFPVAFGMLTPMGMRQRYFLGRFMNQRVKGDFDMAK
jgi:hypothetical protein